MTFAGDAIRRARQAFAPLRGGRSGSQDGAGQRHSGQVSDADEGAADQAARQG